MKECSADASEKQKVIEMLKRTEEDSTLEDLELEDDLHERLHGLDLERDIDKVWDKLTLQVILPYITTCIVNFKFNI